VIRRRRHCHESQLLEAYFGNRQGDPLDPRLADHLDACADCARQYREMTRLMDDLRTEADAEVAELFSDGDLLAQQERIARRLERFSHAARVISFPAGPAAGHPSGGATRVARHWLTAAAAAAGLFVGVAVGTQYDSQSARTATSPPQRTAPVPAPAPALENQTAVVLEPQDDNDFLGELDFALGGPRSSELMLLDALTPSVRDVRISQVSY
jgi:hypothetical protein